MSLFYQSIQNILNTKKYLNELNYRCVTEKKYGNYFFFFETKISLLIGLSKHLDHYIR